MWQGVTRRAYSTRLEDLRKDDREFSKSFKKLPDAYTNFDVNEAVFGVFGPNCNPGLHRNDEGLIHRGHRHLVPWSVVKFGNLTLRGNFDKIQYGGHVLEDPGMAHMDVSLSSEGLSDNEVNQDFVDYTNYVNILFDRFVDYLVENAEHFPVLTSVAQTQSKSDRLELLNDYLVRPVKINADGREEILFKSKIFQKFWGGKEKEDFECDWDREVFAEYGLVRTQLPIFDVAGNVTPVTEQAVYTGDVVGLQVTIKPLVWATEHEGVKIAFQKLLNAVVLRRRGGFIEETADEVVSSPFIQ